MKSNARSFFIICLIVLFCAVSVGLSAEPLYSPTWGFRLDLPEDYGFAGGDGKNSFTFRSSQGTSFELIIYPAPRYASVEALAADAHKKIYSAGETELFVYRDKKAALLSLSFPSDPSAGNSRGGSAAREMNEGWGLCIELAEKDGRTPLLLALAYGPAGIDELQLLNLSALDSLSPGEGDRFYPGPVTEFSYPRGEVKTVKLFGLGIEGRSREHDAEAAQALVDREYSVLTRYADTPLWKAAWTRFYRAIHRDSFGRLAEIVFVLERHWNAVNNARPAAVVSDEAKRVFAGKALEWVQTFSYERNPDGRDFVNLVSAALEGRGDCDSRALLWAILMEQANIPAAIMVSAEYNHAMGLGDLTGAGARFDLAGKKWLVAETTAQVGLGRIEQKMSDIAGWLGIVF
jgi:hypothetical protein